MVSMKSLKDSFERLGFRDVSTYINSGNVLFRAVETDARRLESRIDRMLGREYGLNGRTVVRSHSEMARLMNTISDTWTPDPQWRYDVVFLRHAIDSERVLADIHFEPEIEQVVYCPGTLLWSRRQDAATRTAMLKLASRPVYREMTVRNVNTARRLFALMEQMQHKSTPQDPDTEG